MTPTIIIGDVHGLTYWKEVVKNNPACRYVFLGDYLDPYEEIENTVLVNNLKEIIRFKQEHDEDTILLLGNHDLHYFTDKIEQSTRFEFDIRDEVAKLFRDNISLFQFAYQEENCVFTHAGISQQWFIHDFKGNINKNIADQLNSPLPEQEKAIYQCGWMRGGMPNANGGIFWADIHELDKPLQGYTQIVGHNRVSDITDWAKNGVRIIFCDCLFNGHYLKI
jgi:hypothetical protein